MSVFFAHPTNALEHHSVKFRPDIQGLRAVAVLAVVLDHANLLRLRGGFSGVDVFFVISGFLITSLLLDDVARFHRVRFTVFYARRAARILPAATAVIIATAVASSFLLGVLQSRDVFSDSVWAAFFAANIHFANIGTNYFFSGSATSPLQHFWSLAVEEQFYLVWPGLIAFVALVVRAKHRRDQVPRFAIGSTLGVLFASSLYFSIVQTASNPTGAYFSTLDRTWELALGALLAVALPWITRLPASLKVTLAWAGLTAIFLAAFLYTAATPFPGFAALLPAGGSAAVIAGGAGLSRGGAYLLLSSKPLRFTGDISYSLYLWHWPVLVLGADYLGYSDTLVVRVGLVALAFALASLSYFTLENRLRRAKLLLRRAWHGLVLWPIALALVIVVALLATPAVPVAAATGPAANVAVTEAVARGIAAGEANAPIPHATSPSLAVAASDNVDLGDCSAYLHLTSKICQLGDPKGASTVVLFGNSHSAMWEPGLAKMSHSEHWKFYPLVKEACSYEEYTGLRPGMSPTNQCTLWYRWALRQIKLLHPNVIIMGSYTGSSYWRIGETATVHQVRALTARFILLSDTPTLRPLSCQTESGTTQRDCVWPAGCLTKAGATQASCLWHETSAMVQLQTQT
ncbi:MAG: acyltransferase family protein, partial [Acidimicrobiales bacterium]